jgi:dynein heavy chain 2
MVLCDLLDVFSMDGKPPNQKITKAFVLPRSVEIAAFKEIISALPEIDNVTLFGLPANIDRTMQKNTSQSIISQLQLLHHNSHQSERFNKDQWNTQLIPFLQLWKNVHLFNIAYRWKRFNNQNNHSSIH